MYAITGASGHLGRKVVASLTHRVPASEIVAVVRNPVKAADLGVDVREADYTDVPALDAAFAGIDKLLLISSNSLDRPPEHANVLAAATSAGVKHIFYTSLLVETEARGVSTGVLKDGSGNLSRLIGRPTASIQDAVSEALALITLADVFRNQ